MQYNGRGRLSVICQKVLRQSSSSHQAVIRQPSGSCQAVVRQSSGGHQKVISWSSVGCRAVVNSHQAVIRQLSDSLHAVIRQLSGSRQAVIRLQESYFFQLQIPFHPSDCKLQSTTKVVSSDCHFIFQYAAYQYSVFCLRTEF